MNKEGYTLIEIITVIVILAVILAITVPPILFGLISSTARSSFESDAKFILKGIDYKN
jgi:prepilin-type N-terminal cleavage/methylation domain-containing protein